MLITPLIIDHWLYTIDHSQLTDDKFSYKKSLKTKEGKDFLNLQSFLCVTSQQITSVLYKTSITPHQIIFISLIFGLAASFMIIQSNKIIVIAGAILLFYKNVLDKVDGSLARAKGLDSRRGRFYDSISDFTVSLALFTAISFSLYRIYNSSFAFVIGFIGLLSSMLQCSYFIFYQVSLIKLSGKQTVNRLNETVTDEDLKTHDRLTLFLQRMFLIIYGWQDFLVYNLDKWQLNKLKSIKKTDTNVLYDIWYHNKSFLTITSLLSIGSHIFFIALFAVLGDFRIYLILNLVLWNLLLFSCIIYHYLSTRNKIISSGLVNTF